MYYTYIYMYVYMYNVRCYTYTHTLYIYIYIYKSIFIYKVPWAARRSNQLILREINPEYSLEGLTLKLKLQYFGHLMQTDDSLEKCLGWERSRAEGEEGIRG